MDDGDGWRESKENLKWLDDNYNDMYINKVILVVTEFPRFLHENVLRKQDDHVKPRDDLIYFVFDILC